MYVGSMEEDEYLTWIYDDNKNFIENLKLQFPKCKIHSVIGDYPDQYSFFIAKEDLHQNYKPLFILLRQGKLTIRENKRSGRLSNNHFM